MSQLFGWNKIQETFSTTPKLRIILTHLKDYFDKTELTLLKTNDELVESMHQHVFKRMMKGYNVTNIFSPKHGDLLMNLVLRINAYNLLL